MAYGASLVAALSYVAPQIGVLSGATKPTDTEATAIWADQYNVIRLALLARGLSTTPTTSSIAEGWLQRCERLLTGGYVLAGKATISKEGAAPDGASLIADGRRMLATLNEPATYAALVGSGLSAASPATRYPATSSHWVDWEDGSRDDTPGTGAPPYPEPPAVYEGGKP